MYNYITGIIKEIGTNFVVIENNNIGYQIYVGNPYVYRENLEYTIYLYNYIREDEYTLYGFKKKEDAEKLSVNTGFPIIACPIINTPMVNNQNVSNLIVKGLKKQSQAKDWSDIYLYFGKERFIEEFTKALNYAG